MEIACPSVTPRATYLFSRLFAPHIGSPGPGCGKLLSKFSRACERGSYIPTLHVQCALFFAGHFLNICKNDLLPSPLQKAGCFFGPGQKHHWFDWWCQLLQYIPNQHIQIHQHFFGDEVKPSSGSRRANLTLRQVLSCTQWMYLIFPLFFGSQLKDSTSISHHLMVGLNPSQVAPQKVDTIGN